jgi:hypothetical protein
MDPMQLVRLYTVDGECLVSGRVPPFVAGAEADVILWGDRYFTIDRIKGRPIVDDEGALFYTEAFAVALVDIDRS